jgi:acyl-coenzyme A thioesterase PaaI-like protein
MSSDVVAPEWKAMRSGGFSALVGPILARREGSGWAYAFQSGPQHENRQGAVHGGMLLTFADHALGAIAWEAGGRRKCVTMQLDSQFVTAAIPGDFVECHGEVVRSARSVIFMRGALTVGERVVLAVTGIWKVVGE